MLRPYSLDDSQSLIQSNHPLDSEVHSAYMAFSKLLPNRPGNLGTSQKERLIEELVNAVFNWDFHNQHLILNEEHWRIKKPRIDFYADITSHGNLTFCWRPTNSARGLSDNESDFDDHMFHRYKAQYGYDRPSNVFVFIHGIHRMAVLLRSDEETDREFGDKCFDLMQALYYSIGTTLSKSFQVNFINDIEGIKADDDSTLISSRKPITDWEIYNVKERRQEIEAAWLDGFDEEYGISLDEFIDVYGKHDSDEKVSRAFKKKGIRLTPAPVRDIHARLARYHPAKLNMDGENITGEVIQFSVH